MKYTIFFLIFFLIENMMLPEYVVKGMLSPVDIFIGMVIAAINLAVLILHFCLETFAIQHLPWDTVYIQDFVSFIITSITILVIAVPEGLPVAVMVSLAYSVKVTVSLA